MRAAEIGKAMSALLSSSICRDDALLHLGVNLLFISEHEIKVGLSRHAHCQEFGSIRDSSWEMCLPGFRPASLKEVAVLFLLFVDFSDREGREVK